uniref:Uncharacterized protein n=1 Tax=Arundo donax TaxID=35708 RepID=A0A0A8YYZ4_ARUDO
MHGASVACRSRSLLMVEPKKDLRLLKI